MRHTRRRIKSAREIAAHAWATARGAQEAAALAIEVKLRAERKGGEFLSENEQLGKGKKSLTLRDLGINHNESSRWQAMAKILSDGLSLQEASRDPSQAE